MSRQPETIVLPYLTLGSKWTSPVLALLLQGRVLRFSQIRRGIAGLSPKMLTGIRFGQSTR